MYIINVTYTKPIEEIDKHLVAHRAFLDKFYATGNLICSGPQNPRTGGIIVCTFPNADEVWKFIHQDPFYINGIADYSITEFMAVKYAKEIEKFVV